MYFILSCSSGLLQYGCLLMNIDTKKTIWKVGIYAGMIGSGYAAFGFLMPQVNPWPCLTFMGATAFMLGAVALDYYKAPAPDSYTPEQKEESLEAKQSAVKQLAIGFGCMLAMATLISFVNGQQDNQNVQQGFAGVVYRLADEVKTLHEAVTTLTSDVKQLKVQARKQAIVDSIANAKTLRNQEKMLQRKR